MSVDTELFAGLRTLVSDRVFPNTFEQPDGELPEWPAIRYTIVTANPEEDLCGDGDDSTADIRVQLDVVHDTYTSMKNLRLQVMAAMALMVTPARCQLWFETYDDETKTHRAVLDYIFSGSSAA